LSSNGVLSFFTKVTLAVGAAAATPAVGAAGGEGAFCGRLLTKARIEKAVIVVIVWNYFFGEMLDIY